MIRKRLARQLSIMRLWLIPGMKVKRYVSVAALGTLILIVGVIFGALWLLEEQRDVVAIPLEQILISDGWHRWGGWLAFIASLVGISLSILAVARLNRSLLSNWFARPKEAAVVLSQRLSLAKGPKVVALGGGTGLSNLLRGLRKYSSNITAVVTVSDDGGSSGRLRSAFNMPAPGDISDCLAALSDNESELSRLLEYRFSRGNELKGHTFGNLFITTLTEVEGDFGQAIRTLNALLNLTGAVFPATPEVVSLHATKVSGEQVVGESTMRLVDGAVQALTIEPANPPPTPEVLGAIVDADVVVLGPGSLFTSTLPPILVPAIRRTLQGSSAKLIYICNIMTEAGETDHFTAFDHVQAIYNHLGRYPDQVIVNSSLLDETRIESYKLEKAEVVKVEPEKFKAAGIELLSIPLLSSGQQAYHDSLTLAHWINEFAKNPVSQNLRKELVSA